MGRIHKAFLLNKIFSGGWLNQGDDHIGHEVIDFILADKGEHYVYFSPWGAVQSNVVVKGDDNFRTPRGKEYEVQYLLLTSGYHKKDHAVEVLFVIELKRKLHKMSTAKKTNANKINKNYEEIKKLIDKEKIIYNNKPLYDVYPKFDSKGERDRSLFVNFEAKKMYQANKPIIYKFKQSILRGNKFTIKDDDKYKEDYAGLEKLISKKIKDGDLKEYKPKSMPKLIEEGFRTTFIDLIDYGELEQAFTNILASVLKQGDMIKRFCQTFKKESEVIDPSNFIVSKEKKVVGGRMDCCAVSESGRQKVIIENKINSGLNGIKSNATSQLSTYYKWGKKLRVKDCFKPLCFVVFPDAYETKIIEDIMKHDKNMKPIYNLVTYGKVAKFLKDNKDTIPTTYEFYRYIDDIIKAFENLSHKSKEHFYAEQFLKATF